MNYDSAYQGAYNGARDYQRRKDRHERMIQLMEDQTRRKVDRKFLKMELDYQRRENRKALFEKHKDELKNIPLDKKFDYLSEYMKEFVGNLQPKKEMPEFDEWLCQKLFYDYFSFENDYGLDYIKLPEINIYDDYITYI